MVLSLATILHFHGGLPDSIKEQIGSVNEYHDNFIEYSKSVQVSDPEIWLPCFLMGLKFEIYREVFWKKPKSLIEAWFLAKSYELKMEDEKQEEQVGSDSIINQNYGIEIQHQQSHIQISPNIQQTIQKTNPESEGIPIHDVQDQSRAFGGDRYMSSNGAEDGAAAEGKGEAAAVSGADLKGFESIEDLEVESTNNDDFSSVGDSSGSSGAEDGASARGKGEAHNTPVAGASAHEMATTLGDGDLRTHRFRRVCSIADLAIGGASGGGTSGGQHALWWAAIVGDTRKKEVHAAATASMRRNKEEALPLVIAPLPMVAGFVGEENALLHGHGRFWKWKKKRTWATFCLFLAICGLNQLLQTQTAEKTFWSSILPSFYQEQLM